MLKKRSADRKTAKAACEFSFFVCVLTFHCYLVDVVGVDACVKAHVEVVEHLHHLQRSTGRRDRSEAHDV